MFLVYCLTCIPRRALLGLFGTLAVLFLFVAAMPVAYAQAGLDVRVLNTQTGAPVEGALVRVTNERIGFNAQRRTSAQGTARWSGLSTSGQYDVFVEETDTFYEARVENVSLRANYTRSVTLLLSPISEFELEEVVVEGATGIAEVNRINAEVSSSLPERELQDLPVEGRNFTQALYRLPNVTPATGFYPEAPNVSINGANGLFTTYLIDGMDNNENFLGGPQFEVPTGFVKDITVLTSTYSAEYGRTGNGIFNVTTKSGGNQVTGEAFYLTRPGPVIDGSSPFAQRDLSGNAVKEGFMRQQGGVGIGGPIVEDQTFYYVNVEHTADWKDNLLNVPQLGLAETVQGTNQFTYGSAKVDHRWTGRWRSSLRANVSRVRVDRQGGGLAGGVTFPSAGNTQQRDGLHLALQNTYTGDRVVLESNVQYSRFNWDYADAQNPNSPQVTVLDPQEQTVAVLGNPGFAFNNLENTLQLQQKATWSLGTHTLRAGLDVVASDMALTGGGNPSGNYTVRLTSDQLDALQDRGISSSLNVGDLQGLPGTIDVLNYGVEVRPNAYGTRQDLVALYLEDQFTPTAGLNVTAGLRWDYDSLSKGGSDSGDWNNIAPRLSLNYALGERSSLRGGYGLFYDKIVYSVYSDALQQGSTADGFRNQLSQLIDHGVLPGDTDLDRVTFAGNLTANASDVPYLGGPTPSEVQSARDAVFSNERRILNPNGYDNPYTHQFSLGVQRQLGTSTLFYVDLIHTRSYNLFRLRDLNAPDPYDITRAQVEAANDPASLVRSQLDADQTRRTDIFERNADGTIQFDADGNPQYKPGVARQIIMTETAGEARYWAANVNLVKDRAQDDWAYRLSYTLSRLRNNTDDINFRAEEANNFADEWGPSVNDRTHVLSGVLSYFPTSDVRLTLASLIQSGQPINRIPDARVFGTTDLNGDGRSFGAAYVGNSDRSPGEARNSDRLPWSTTFDVSVQYTLPLTSGRVVARADVFNVFNTENLSGYANNATQSNQIQFGPASSGRLIKKNAGPPRQFQFGLRYAF